MRQDTSRDAASTEDDFWTDHVPLFTGQLPSYYTKPQKIWGRYLSVHKAAGRIRQALAARGCALLFLPPYSPDFTPIEQALSKLKAILRGLGVRTREALVEAVRVALNRITAADAAAWFVHAGYTLPAQDY